MQHLFTSDFFTTNRKNLRRKLPDAVHMVVMTANGLQQKSNDTTYSFSQDRNFWYLTGLEEPNITLVLDGANEYLSMPKSNAVRDTFDGAISEDELTHRSGIRAILSYEEGWKRLSATLSHQKTVGVCASGPLFQQTMGLYVHPARRVLLEKLRRLARGVALSDIRPILARLRQIKQLPEIAAITEAVRITTDALEIIRKQTSLQRYSYEYELEAALSYEFRKQGAGGHAYSPIVAAGKHATTLHYVANSGPLGQEDLIVVDVGAEYNLYAADITRTLSITPPSSRQKNVVEAVREVQQQASRLLRPGCYLRDYETKVVSYMGEKLKSLGLITSTHDTQAIRHYFPHATSHFLGLDVHDVGDYSKALVPGMVLTCEPGIYIPEEGIGVRIEDDIVITDSGNHNLSRHCSYLPFDV